MSDRSMSIAERTAQTDRHVVDPEIFAEVHIKEDGDAISLRAGGLKWIRSDTWVSEHR